jgi:hypothetical protein
MKYIVKDCSDKKNPKKEILIGSLQITRTLIVKFWFRKNKMYF